MQGEYLPIFSRRELQQGSSESETCIRYSTCLNRPRPETAALRCEVERALICVARRVHFAPVDSSHDMRSRNQINGRSRLPASARGWTSAYTKERKLTPKRGQGIRAFLLQFQNNSLAARSMVRQGIR